MLYFSKYKLDDFVASIGGRESSCITLRVVGMSYAALNAARDTLGLRTIAQLPFNYATDDDGEAVCYMYEYERYEGAAYIRLLYHVPGEPSYYIWRNLCDSLNRDVWQVRVPRIPFVTVGANFRLRADPAALPGEYTGRVVMAVDTGRVFRIVDSLWQELSLLHLPMEIWSVDQAWRVMCEDAHTEDRRLLFAAVRDGDVMFFEDEISAFPMTVTCNICGGRAWYRLYMDSSDDTICHRCYEEIRPRRYHIQRCDPETTMPHQYSYDYKPTWKFKKTRLDTGAVLYLGVEQEFSTTNNDAKRTLCAQVHEVDRDEEYIFQKSDGSLQYGTEVVSHPLSLRYWRTFMPEYAEMLENIAGVPGLCVDRDNDGMHVHLSSASMTLEHKAALVEFFHVFSEYAPFEELVGRDYYNHEYARPVNMLFEHDIEDYSSKERMDLAVDYLRNYSHDDRYVAVNLCNSRTMEIRVFHSTVSWKTFLMRLELAHAAYQYTRDYTLQMFDFVGTRVLWHRFRHFVHQRSDNDYNELKEVM